MINTPRWHGLANTAVFTNDCAALLYRHCWLGLPAMQDQICTLVPSALTRPAMSRHLPSARSVPSERTRPRLSGPVGVAGVQLNLLDPALADPAFLQAHLDAVLAGQPKRAAAWAQDALRRADLRICWAVTADRSSTVALERAVLDALSSSPLWNGGR
jgi:hypothetical protein